MGTVYMIDEERLGNIFNMYMYFSRADGEVEVKCCVVLETLPVGNYCMHMHMYMYIHKLLQ